MDIVRKLNISERNYSVCRNFGKPSTRHIPENRCYTLTLINVDPVIGTICIEEEIIGRRRELRATN
jgi:hypothetical protein